jgi:hypothetical protein
MPLVSVRQLSYEITPEGVGNVYDDRRIRPIASYDNVRSIEHLTHLYESKRYLHRDKTYVEQKPKHKSYIDELFSEGKVIFSTLMG